MERAYRPKSPESREGAMIQQLATEASRLVREKKAENIPGAIRMVLDRYHGGHSADLYRQIASELGARGARKKATGNRGEKTIRSVQQDMWDEDQQMIERLRREQTLRDARAHELRQPRSAWDPDHPENSP